MNNISNIAVAEWFRGVIPGAGEWNTCAGSDGTFDARTEALTVLNRCRVLDIGTHQVSVRAMDDVSNWGPATTASL